MIHKIKSEKESAASSGEEHTSAQKLMKLVTINHAYVRGSEVFTPFFFSPALVVQLHKSFAYRYHRTSEFSCFHPLGALLYLSPCLY